MKTTNIDDWKKSPAPAITISNGLVGREEVRNDDDNNAASK